MQNAAYIVDLVYISTRAAKGFKKIKEITSEGSNNHFRELVHAFLEWKLLKFKFSNWILAYLSLKLLFWSVFV